MNKSTDLQNIFLQSPHSRFTYADLHAFIYHFKQCVSTNIVKNGPSVGLLTSSCDEAVLIIAACWKLDIPFVCFNPDETTPVLGEQIDAIAPAVIFTDDNELCSDSSIFTNIKKFSSEHWQARQIASIEKGIETNKHDDEQIFAYFFTSGTTSKPKIVPLKRRQIRAAAHASTQNIAPRPNDFWLLCMPLNHIGGVSIILRSLLYRSAIYRVDKFTRSISKLLSANMAIKVASLVPTMLKRLLQEPAFYPHTALKFLLGGGPVHQSLLEETKAKNITVITSYGMTETSAQIAAGSTKHHSLGASSVGSIFKPNEIQIRDDQDNELAAGKRGTIWLKGPQVFDGYYRSKKETVFDKNGWFNTGDVGKVDKNEQLHISTRRTDLIVTGGENVSPPEVEESLLSLAAIKEAAVIGRPSEEWGEIVAAALVTESGKKINISRIKQQLKTTLAPYKVPKQFIELSALPRTTSGKVKRKELAMSFD